MSESGVADAAARRVREMYARFPYPSQDTGEQRLTELANLLWLFSRETSYDFRGKRVLDVGTGTGHRLITSAQRFPDTQFVAVDVCAPPLEIARATAHAAGVGNVEFRQYDLLDGATDLGRFDVVLCMGVLHHLADPALGLRQLARHLAPDGVLFLYLYGERGARERMRRKEILSLLLAGANEGDRFGAGIALAKALGFDALEFGWHRNADDARSRDALIVDSYLNAQETLFDMNSILDFMRPSGPWQVMAYGLTCGSRGYLLDTALGPPMLTRTEPARHLPSAELAAAYERLELQQKYRLIELWYEPNGYTLLAYKNGGTRWFSRDGRVRRNSLSV